MIACKLENDFFGEFNCPSDFIGWDKLEYSLERSETWKGVFEGFGLALGFFGPALDYLLNCYNRFGAEAVVIITVTEFDELGESLEFTGLLNFAESAEFFRLADSQQPRNDYKSGFQTLTVIPVPSDLKTLLEARRSAKFALPIAREEIYKGDNGGLGRLFVWQDQDPPLDLNGSQLSDLRLFAPDIFFLHSRAQRVTDVYQHELLPYQSVQNPTNLLAGDWFLQQAMDCKSPKIAQSIGQDLLDGNNASAITPFFTAENAGVYRARIRLRAQIEWTNKVLSIRSRFTFRIGWGSVANQNFTEVYVTEVNDPAGATRQENVIINYTQDLVLQANDNVYWYQRLTVGAGGINQTFKFAATDFAIDFEVLSYPVANYQNGFFLHEFSAAVLTMVIGREVLQSRVMGRPDSYPTAYDQDGNAGLTAITTGAFLRKKETVASINGQPYPLLDKPQLSISDWWESINSVFNLALWIDKENDKIIIENAREVFDSNVEAARFNFVDNIKISTAPDLIYNEIEFKFNKFEDRGEGFGLDPHASLSFNAPLRFTANKYDLNSPFLASGESITIARTAGAGTSAKTGYDTDKFFIRLNRGARVRLPVIGVNDTGTELYVPANELTTSYFAQFWREPPFFAPGPLPDVNPQFFELFGSGVNNGTYGWAVAGGARPWGLVITIGPALPAPNQIVTGQSYIEVITRNPVFTYSAKTTQGYEQILNIDDPESGLNYDLTPKRNLLRHKFYWNTGVLRNPAALWQFGSGEGNTELITQKVEAAFDSDEFLNETLKESQAIQPFDQQLPGRYLPEIIEFEVPVRIGPWKDIIQKRHGLVYVSDRDTNHLAGYILSAKRQRAGERVIVKFKLLRKFDGFGFEPNKLPI